MDEHDRRRRSSRELQENGTLRIGEQIEPWELELLVRALAKLPGTAVPATPETHDGE